MPQVMITLAEGRTDDQKARAASDITRAVCEHLQCKPETVSVVFNDVKGENWAIAGKMLSSRN